MQIHPAIQDINNKFIKNELHAARSARLLSTALVDIVHDSRALSCKELFGEIEANIDSVLSVMPGYAPPLNVLHRVMTKFEDALESQIGLTDLKHALISEAKSYVNWSEQARDKVAAWGTTLIPENGSVFSFTLSETVMSVFRKASLEGKHYSVLITESRPNFDGLVTASELAKLGVPVSFSIDACMGEMIPMAQIMLIGAEAIMADCSAICKTGSYPAALIARENGIPVYLLVDTMKFNASSLMGIPLPLNALSHDDLFPNEIPSGVDVTGHLFDRTPCELLSGLVTELGIISPQSASSMMRDFPISKTITRKLLEISSRLRF